MKKTIRQAMLALLLVPALALGVSVLAGDVSPVAAADLSLQGGADSAKGDDQPANLFDGDSAIFKTVTNVLLFLVGAIAVIMLIIGGIRYVVSGGDQSNVTAAKNTILYAIVGIIVAVLAYAAVNFVTSSFASQ